MSRELERIYIDKLIDKIYLFENIADQLVIEIEKSKKIAKNLIAMKDKNDKYRR